MLLSFGTEFEVNLESPVSSQTEHKGSRSYTWSRKTFSDSAFLPVSESRSDILVHLWLYPRLVCSPLPHEQS